MSGLMISHECGLYYSGPQIGNGNASWQKADSFGISKRKIESLNGIYMLAFGYFHPILSTRYVLPQLQLPFKSCTITRQVVL